MELLNDASLVSEFDIMFNMDMEMSERCMVSAARILSLFFPAQFPILPFIPPHVLRFVSLAAPVAWLRFRSPKGRSCVEVKAGSGGGAGPQQGVKELFASPLLKIPLAAAPLYFSVWHCLFDKRM